MGKYTILQNSSIAINLQSDVIETGWRVSEGYAIHDSCNIGEIEYPNFITIVGQEYIVTYTLVERTSGEVYVIIGGVNGINRTVAGTYTETITAIDTTGLKFYSNGELKIGKEVKVTNGVTEGVTLAFNENANKWVSYLSYKPEMMAKFIDGFITFKNGEFWEHNVNEIRNNFYDEQYTSQITFYCNLNPTEVKQFFSMREKSTHVWSVTDAYIAPTHGKKQGQRTRLKRGRFKNLQGDWFSDFLKNLEDPRFSTDLEALMKGADMQGNVMEITIENNDTVEVRLLSVDITVATKQYTY